MIGSTLSYVSDLLNQFLCDRLQIDAANRKIVFGSFFSPDGSPANNDENTLLLSLVSIRKETVAGALPSRPVQATPGVTSGGSQGVYVNQSPPVHLNLMVLIAANFKPEQMKTGLDLLTLAILYLQGHPVWEIQGFPGLPSPVRRLAFELATLDFDQQGHMWGSIGAKYVPSVLYQVRMLTLESDSIDTITPAIGEVIAESGSS